MPTFAQSKAAYEVLHCHASQICFLKYKLAKPVIPTLRKARQDDCLKFEASLGYEKILYLKKLQIRKLIRGFSVYRCLLPNLTAGVQSLGPP